MESLRKLAADGKTAMVVDGIAYDFTDFMKDHPGGSEYLRKNAGKVATEEFVASHPVDIIERTLSADQFKSMTLGPIDESTIQPSDIPDVDKAASHAAPVDMNVGIKPSLDSCINIYDFEAIASRTVPEQGWVYYSSGADDEITLRENHNAYHRIWMKPRVMVNVKDVDFTTTILGHKTSMPMFLSAVAMCKLGHPEGETAWMKGACEQGIFYMVPTLSGCSFDDIVKARTPKYPMFFQLYVNQDKDKVKKIVQRAEAAGCSALFITCDAPQLGNRERDRRVKVTHSGANVQSGSSGGKAQGTSKALTTFIDPSLSWDDLPWFQSITKMKIVLKGIGSKEDAIQALEMGCAGVLLSNHGGRQLDFARSSIEVLPEVMDALKAHKKYDPEKFEVFVDGGIRRGTDIFKALALGAKAVGVGRPALYAMSAYGAEGVSRMIQIMKDELTMTMRLMGTPTLADIKSASVCTDNLSSHIAAVPQDMLQKETYIPPVSQAVANHFERYDAAKKEADAAAAQVSQKTDGEPSTGEAVIKLLSEVSKALLKTIFALDARTSINRTAMFLVLYIVVHVAGNMTLFLGPESFNAYGFHLVYGPLGQIVKVIELYLAAAFILHVVVGSYLTVKYKKLVPSKKASLMEYPLGQAKLALTGTVITAFVVLHVLQFRFNRPELAADGGHPDLYSTVLDVLRDPKMAALYIVGTCMVGVHLFSGWAKTMSKMDFSGDQKKFLKPVIFIGQFAATVASAGFVAVTLKAHFAANQ